MTVIQRANGSGPRPETAGVLRGLRGQTAAMAVGTTLSRLTGLLRVLVLAYALGFNRLADAYNLANNAPNMLYDIVIGGVLAATFIPVFVDRLATRSEEEAWRAISAVITITAVILVLSTVAFWLLAPQIIDAFTALNHTHSAAGQALVDQERSVATTLLRWFVPQVALYGFISLATALLNTRRRFVAPMWTAIANNIVCIFVLLWFHQLAGDLPSLHQVQTHTSLLVLLGLGTTVGVAIQALLLVPSLRRAKLSLRWRFEPGHEAVRAVARLGSWTFGFVAANQITQFIVLALAFGSGGAAPVSAYMYAYIFLQMPFAIVAVSIMSVVTPDLSERWALGQTAAFRKRLATGLRAVMAVILPAAVGMLLLARPGAALLLAHGAASARLENSAVATTGATLAMFALGLPGFCAFQYVVRILQSMQRTRVAFWLYLVENGINVVLGIALVHPMGVRGLALSLSIAYSVAALIGLQLLRNWLGDLGDHHTWAPLRRVAAATVAMAAVVLVVVNVSGAMHGWALLGRVVASILAGGATFLVVVVALGALAARREGSEGPPKGPPAHRPPPEGPPPPFVPTRGPRGHPPNGAPARGPVRPVPSPPRADGPASHSTTVWYPRTTRPTEDRRGSP